jgi:hypothetical protein
MPPPERLESEAFNHSALDLKDVTALD